VAAGNRRLRAAGGPVETRGQERVIVDADMGVLNDDAVALFMLLNSPNVEVLGVTIVPGNSWVEHGTAAALRQLELIGRKDVPVFMGVREPLMGSRQPWLEAEERIWGKSEYLGAYGRPRPESYLKLDREPAIGYPTITPAAEHAVYYTNEEYSRIAAAPETPVTKLFRQLHGRRFERDPKARSFDTPADFPAGTQKMKVLMDIDRKAFSDLYVDLMTRRATSRSR
jgi:hypothetical protein